MENVRVRIAPSPTGDGAHVGLARTALFNWLFARHHGGTFILRSEDTDLERSRPEYEAAIQRDLEWLGLAWDEFYRQSERLERHREVARQLLARGAAYRCYCTAEELKAQQARAAREKRSYVYEGRCRLLAEALAQGGASAERAQAQLEALQAEGRAPVVRFKLQDFAWDDQRWVTLPRPPHREKLEESGAIIVHDLIKGDTRYTLLNPARGREGAVLGDFVILRADGRPTYNFAVVVDDLDMRVSHVIRGDEHLNNTPRQMLLYAALGAPLPQFAHLPMILDQNQQKLSKRRSQVEVFIDRYRRRGFLPEAMINFLARLGWSCGDQEIFSREELIERFSLSAVGKSPAIFDDEKLLWLNQHHLIHGDPQRLGERLRAQLVLDGVLAEARAQALPAERLAAAVVLMRERVKTLGELAERGRYLFRDDFEYDAQGVAKFFTPESLALVRDYAQALQAVEDFSVEELDRFTRAWLEARGLKLKHLAQPARLALTGRTTGAGLFETLAFFGREAAVRRLERAAARLSEP